MAVLWVGLGVKVLSMAPSCIPAVKKVLRTVTLQEAQTLAAEVLAACATDSADEIYARCRGFLLDRLPDFESLRAFFAAG
jgi:phosphoenolpyruvate-protein kinase (PTS system EI component)